MTDRARLPGESEAPVLSWALTFLIIALVAAFFGFGGIATGAVEIAQILFVLFLVAFLISVVVHLVTGNRPPRPPL